MIEKDRKRKEMKPKFQERNFGKADRYNKKIKQHTNKRRKNSKKSSKDEENCKAMRIEKNGLERENYRCAYCRKLVYHRDFLQCLVLKLYVTILSTSCFLQRSNSQIKIKMMMEENYSYIRFKT